jgi:hypothetical protein
MQIHTFCDDDQGAEGAYERRRSVSLLLTPMEAEDLLVALQDLLATEREWDEGWHVHTYASDESCEIVLLPDRKGTAKEPTRDERLDAWLTELAAEGGSVVRAVRAVAESRQISDHDAKQLLRAHPAWRDRL